MEVQFGRITLAVLAVISAVFLLPKKWRWPALALLLVFALVIVWFWPGTGGGIWELHEILHGRSHLSFGSNRIAVWKYSLRLAPERLLTGGGSDTFVLRFNQYLHDTGYIIPERQGQTLLPHYFDNPHNEYIAQLMNHGLPAMLLLILLMVTSVMRRREAGIPVLTPYSAAVLCYAVQAFFSFPVCLVAPMFWSLLGMSFRSDENC
jgi:O-antigen ligase